MANLDYDTFRIVHNASAAGEFSLTEDRLYLVGACSISDIKVEFGLAGERSAGSTTGRDGVMKNPVPSGASIGYDNRLVGYDASVNAMTTGFPITMDVGDVLVVAESSGEPPPSYAPPGNSVLLERAIAVHCVASAPSATDFAPPYCGTKTIRSWSAGLLANLPTALTAPNPLGSVRTSLGSSTGSPTPTNLAAKIAKLQLDHGILWSQRPMHPFRNMRDYGRELATDWTDALLMCCTDDRTTALVQHMVQLGIDLYGIYEAGGRWPADGGHNVGRKAPIMFAGKVLNVAAMMNIGDTGNDFQEDGNYFYNSSGVATWQIQPGRTDGIGTNYETLNWQLGMANALAILHLGLDAEWGNNSYFEYMDDSRTAGRACINNYHENVVSPNWDTLYTAAGIGPAPNPICRVIPGVFL